MLLTLSLTLSAFAAPCAAPTTSDQLLADMGTVQELNLAGDPAAGDAAKRLIGDVSCLGEALPAPIVGPAYRAIAVGAITGGDEATARKWFRAALAADPSGSIGVQDVPGDSPALALFLAVRDEGDSAVVTDSAHTLAEGRWTLDGKGISTLAARDNMPHVLQSYTPEGGYTTWLIEGAAFPPEAVGKAAEVAKVEKDCPPVRPHKKYANPHNKYDLNGDCKADPIPPWPGEKIPLEIAGVALLAGAGGMYGMASMAHADFTTATALPDVVKYQTLTNRLVVVSALTAGVGLGTLGWGVIVSDQGTVVPRISARF